MSEQMGYGGHERLSLIQMILLTDLKAGFEKKRLTTVVIVMVIAQIY